MHEERLHKKVLTKQLEIGAILQHHLSFPQPIACRIRFDARHSVCILGPYPNTIGRSSPQQQKLECQSGWDIGRIYKGVLGTSIRHKAHCQQALSPKFGAANFYCARLKSFYCRKCISATYTEPAHSHRASSLTSSQLTWIEPAHDHAAPTRQKCNHTYNIYNHITPIHLH